MPYIMKYHITEFQKLIAYHIYDSLLETPDILIDIPVQTASIYEEARRPSLINFLFSYFYPFAKYDLNLLRIWTRPF